MPTIFTKRFLIVALIITIIATVPGGNTETVFAAQTRITFWDYYTTQSPAIEAGIAAFEAANPDIKVERKQHSPLEQMLLLDHVSYGSGTAPDVLVAPLEADLPFARAVGNSTVAPLSDFPDFPAFKATFPHPDVSFAEGYNVFGGKAYSAPLNLPVPSLYLYINTDLYRKAGLVNPDGSLMIPNTMDDLVRNSKAIVDTTGQYSLGFGGASSNIEAFWSLCQLTGPYSVDHKAGWNPSTGKYEFSRRVCFRKAIDYLLTMRDEKFILPDSMTSDDATIRDQFVQGKFAHYLGDSSSILDWQQKNPEFKNYIVARIPLVGADAPITYFYTQPGGVWLCIHAFSQQKDAAWKLIKFFYSPAFQDIWAKQGNGVGIFTSAKALPPDSPWSAIQGMHTLVIPGPDSIQRMPDLSKVKVQLLGANPAQLLASIYRGQITDIEAALADLDSRSEDALNAAIQNARADGQTIDRSNFEFEGWDPRRPYDLNLARMNNNSEDPTLVFVTPVASVPPVSPTARPDAKPTATQQPS